MELATYLMYKSMIVVEANAFNSEAVEDIAAEKITANKSPIRPCGRKFNINVRNI